MMRCFGIAGQSTEPSLDTAVIAVVRTVKDQADIKAIWSTAFEKAMKHAVHRLVLGPHIVDAVMTRTIIASVLTVLVAMFVKNEV